MFSGLQPGLPVVIATLLIAPAAEEDVGRGRHLSQVPPAQILV